MRVDIWSDVVCPWCAIGKAHLDAALARFEHAAEVEIVWRSFELDPGARPVVDGDYARMLARKYGTSERGGQAMIDRMTATAAAAGVEFHLDRARPGNSFDAHRLVHLAADSGRQTVVKEHFLRAYLQEGAAIGDILVLRRLAVDAGLDGGEVDQVLGSDAYSDAVRADERAAGAREITAVPTFVVDDRFVVPGAQSADTLLRVLRRAWDARQPVTVLDGSSDEPGAAACGPDGCAV